MKEAKFASYVFMALLLAMPWNASAAQNSGDTEALSTVKAIDQHEIDAANEAMDKRPSSQVLDFAQMMKNDHSANLQKTESLAQELNLSLSDTPGIMAMKAKNAAKSMTLKPLSGDSFEKAYMDAMVSGHQEALDKIDNELLPKAENADVKKHLTETRTAVAAHLQKAKQIQAGLQNR